MVEYNGFLQDWKTVQLIHQNFSLLFVSISEPNGQIPEYQWKLGLNIGHQNINKTMFLRTFWTHGFFVQSKPSIVSKALKIWKLLNKLFHSSVPEPLQN